MTKKFTHLINAALDKAMEIDESVLCYGLGMNDSIRIFGTTNGLVEKYGEDRVFDMPTAENGMTGVSLGLAIKGFRPILTHCRLDFMLLALDQIINGAAKWNSLFAGTMPVPVTYRAILGRGWGQGPTHCQSLQACFAQIPGLKVVMPSFPEDAYGLLLSSIFDDSPVIFLEHRWVHNTTINSTDNPYQFVPLGKARKVTSGSDVTVVAMSYMSIEALHAVRYLASEGIHCELLDLRTVKPIDWDAIYTSVKKTGHLIVLDTGFEFCSIASEIIANVTMNCFRDLKAPPIRLAMPDYPTLTSPTLLIPSYTYSDDIAESICTMLGSEVSVTPLRQDREKFPRDVPGNWFGGPF